MQVGEHLPAVRDLATGDLEDDAAVGVELPTAPLPAVVVKTDHTAVVRSEDLLQRGLERAARLSPVPPELGEHGVAAHVVAGDRAPPGRVPRAVLREQRMVELVSGSGGQSPRCSKQIDPGFPPSRSREVP